MAALGQTITVVNKSGKIVTSGKHIANLWSEAKAAYRERKAELKVDRDDPDAAQRRAKDKFLDEDKKFDRSRHRPVNSRRRSSSRHSTESHRRRRRYDDDDRRSSYGESSTRHRSSKTKGESKSARGKPRTERGHSEDYYEQDQSSRRKPSRRSPPSPTSPLRSEATRRDTQRSELARRHSDSEFSARPRSMERPTRVSTSPNISTIRTGEVDMDLAYGELPPPLPARPGTEEAEIRHKATALNSLLEEMNCLHHSVSTIMKSLEKNPEAMAAVALTLAEISNLARKLAPGALSGLRATAPAVVALLASPEFLIAAGVGVGMTVIMFGGYKIIKKIRAGKATEEPFPANGKASSSTQVENETEQEVLEEISQADRIKEWRRGLDNADVESVATSVEGELATPAARQRLIEEGVIDPSSSKPWEDKGKDKKDRKDKSKDDKKKKRDGDDRSSKSDSSSSKKDKGKDKEKEPSGLRMLFKR